MNIKAPFPAFGGKSRIAAEVLARLDGPDGSSQCRNWIEPFCFSAAVTLRREPGPVETLNDRNAFVANFWRAVKADPEAVAAHADWPVNEVDLHARHAWLTQSVTAKGMLERVKADPDAFDARIAGWWCWGACCWIGSGWCDEHLDPWQTRPNLAGDGGGNGVHRMSQQLPHLDGDAGCHGRGVNSTRGKRPRLAAFDQAGTGVHAEVDGTQERRPGLSQPGWGVNAGDMHRPQLADQFARGPGVNGNDAAATCEQRRAWLTGWVMRLADRLRPVRVCCGHWMRVCDSPSTMTRLGLTGVFLDPPYRTHLADGSANRTSHIYANDRVQDVNALCDEVQAWCVKWGQDSQVRIALCGLDGEYPEIERTVGGKGGWTVLAWKSNGGYGNRKADGAENVNARRERVWFSPACVRADEGGLFGGEQ